MPGLVTYFDPQPTELAAVLPSPFAAGPPHPLAQRAAEVLQAELRASLASELGLDEPGGGKMFGVLVVAQGDRVGFLRAFSGMAGRRWLVDGFVPPAFDLASREAFWIDGERELINLAAELDELSARAAPLRAQLTAMLAAHTAETEELRARHRASRERRHAERAQTSDEIALRALDQLSRADTAERRRCDARHRAERHELELQLRVIDDEHAAIDGQRAERSRHFLHRIHDTYVLANALGQTRSLRHVFAPAEPPGGAGDCAAPKLLAYAYREGLRPLALAELWWGAPPVTGGRHAGVYYPACRGKCGPILAHMLEGLPTEPPPVFGGGPIAAAEPRTIYEDDWLVVVAKPEGLLSIPGRGGQLHDSVLARLRARYPTATGAMIVHRLDLDASGLLLAAKDEVTHAALQRLFARREVYKRYVAWLDGEVVADGGVVDLALRVDIDDRPRQIVDPTHGKPAITDWQVLARREGRTRVALSPKTGRAHQLRVHAAVGIGAPIVGDRLYGRPDLRLMLHAEALAFVHPHTHERIELEISAPF